MTKAEKLARLTAFCAEGNFLSIQHAANVLFTEKFKPSEGEAPLWAACVARRPDIAEWVAERFGITNDDLAFTEDPLVVPLLATICDGGDLATIQWIIKRFAITKEQMIASECLEGETAGDGERRKGLEDWPPALDWVIDYYGLTDADLAEWMSKALK
jgi:hypothetical protein